MVTLVDKIKKADDAGCEVFNAIRISSNWGFNEPEASKKLLFQALEDAVKDIDPTHRYINMDSFMSLIQQERGSKIQRQVARVNLFVFAVAIWTGENLDEAVHEFFRNVIPKNFSDHSDQLLDLYVAVVSWAASIQVNKVYGDLEEGTGPNVMDVLKDYFPETVEALGLSNTDRNANRLLEKIRNKFDWINELTYLDPWDDDVKQSKATIRRNWINIIYEIIGEFDALYPTLDTQKIARNENDEQTKITKGIASGNEANKNFNLEEDNEEEFTTVPNDISTNQETVDMDEEDEENSNEDKQAISNSFKRATPGDNDGSEDEEQELESLPVKRPRVIRANSQDNQSVLDRDSDDLDSTDNGTEHNPNDISSPQLTNFSSDNLASTLTHAVTEQHSNEHILAEQSLNENQASKQPANQSNPSENVSSENLPHGLPRTINEGPAEGFSGDSSDDDYADALQTMEAERSQSVASIPTRTRRDLPSSRRSRQAAAAITTTSTETARATNTTSETTNNDNDNTNATNTTATPSNTIPTTVEPTAVPSAPKRRKPYTPWTAEEVDALEEGLRLHGGQWALIKNTYKDALCNRTNVQIKDKARNELIYRKKAGEPLGVYAQLNTEVTSFSEEAAANRAARRAAIKRHSSHSQANTDT